VPSTPYLGGGYETPGSLVSRCELCLHAYLPAYVGVHELGQGAIGEFNFFHAIHEHNLQGSLPPAAAKWSLSGEWGRGGADLVFHVPQVGRVGPGGGVSMSEVHGC
jgi:hypothetical protein